MSYLVDKATRERVEVRNGLETFAITVKNQINDEEGLGSKIDEEDREQILDAIKETRDWLDEYGPTADAEDFEEQREKLSGVVNPITSKLYGGAGEEEEYGHDEL